ASAIKARRPAIGPTEARMFHAVNQQPNWLYWPLWLPMQLGNLVVGTAAGLLVAWAVGDLAMAIGVVVAMWLKLVVERFFRKKMAAHLQIRQRSGISEVGAILRGDVPSSGMSFPSGHIILVAAISCVVVPAIPAAWWWVP